MKIAIAIAIAAAVADDANEMLFSELRGSTPSPRLQVQVRDFFEHGCVYDASTTWFPLSTFIGR
jgi:hypothetical protein